MTLIKFNSRNQKVATNQSEESESESEIESEEVRLISLNSVHLKSTIIKNGMDPMLLNKCQ